MAETASQGYKEQCDLIESPASRRRFATRLSWYIPKWHPPHPPHPSSREVLEIYAIPPGRYTRGHAKGQVICETPLEGRLCRATKALRLISVVWRGPGEKSVLKLHKSLKRVGEFTSTSPQEFSTVRYTFP